MCNLCPTQQCQPHSVHCPNCTTDFCSNCKLEWHEGLTCEENNKKLAKEGKVEEPGIPFNSDLIKCCPMCNVPIEKDEGCAQMMCKRCKHVFCWYCLASLDVTLFQMITEKCANFFNFRTIFYFGIMIRDLVKIN